MAEPTSARRTYDQPCPVAHALDLIGERWTLLIIRDLFFGPLRFTDLRHGLDGLAPNLLSERLRHLVDEGIVRQAQLPPPAARTVYELTSAGRELGPVVHELARFGLSRWDDPEQAPPPPSLLKGALLALMAPERIDRHGWTATLDLGEAVLVIAVASARERPGVRPLERIRVRSESGPSATDRTSRQQPNVSVTTTLATLHRLRRGAITCSEAVDTGFLRVDGDEAVTRRLAALLGWPDTEPPNRTARS